jgi:hypothetical protein
MFPNRFKIDILVSWSILVPIFRFHFSSDLKALNLESPAAWKTQV